MPLHRKINARHADPNEHITFSSVLKDFDDQDEAMRLMRALAAQVKPLCKSHGYGINSFEEHAWNPTYGGINYNGGEAIGIVLRGRNGNFLPMPWLIHVVCHELAHIDQMNHSAAFHKVNNRNRAEVQALQARGYFGDGLWSAGFRLHDSRSIQGNGIRAEDLPAYICGGARQKSKKRFSRNTHRRQRAYQVVKPGSAGGVVSGRRKTAKAGSRVRRDFGEHGEVLDDDPGQSTFRKRANTKSAKEMRAEAAEKRLKAMSTASSSASTSAGTLDHFKTEAKDEETDDVFEEEDEDLNAELDANANDSEDDLEEENIDENDNPLLKNEMDDLLRQMGCSTVYNQSSGLKRKHDSHDIRHNNTKPSKRAKSNEKKGGSVNNPIEL